MAPDYQQAYDGFEGLYIAGESSAGSSGLPLLDLNPHDDTPCSSWRAATSTTSTLPTERPRRPNRAGPPPAPQSVRPSSCAPPT